MKMSRYLAIAVIALATTACAGPSAIAPPVASPPPPAAAPELPLDRTLLAARRSFAAAEIEWQSAIAVGRALTARGVIRGDTAVTVRRWNAEARRLIVAGKAAVDTAGAVRAATGLLALVDKLNAITGGK